MSEERETLSATMERNWKEQLTETHAHVVKLITSAILATTEPTKEAA